ncbi:hypothetical protein AKJ62_02465 [candidate division MSBL1 archaeon SCGC-AAA259D14]|uniref:Cupin 2 conserved barrel domain-containing protein n=2 Tax=candidate division MSBL1 TaxID=215777 RepID=A0A133U686_9EURY|nr:hypothetical protein AKJ62_02465 [candidate division MSBL1 archaeon SCGC-AAA259D14]KXA93801.1 hypothetical protein AKJ66_00810 [candidate division MSBL1 archaeon SCGC-AAA259E22]
MKVFDLKEMELEEKAKVFYSVDEFNTRLIDLPAGGKIPTCDMDSYVLFYVVDGKVMVTVDGGEKKLDEGDCLVTEPAALSLKTEEGAKILGIQISKM